MAGGSADAAATLVGCAALWGLEMARGELAQIGAKIGADVPFALSGGTAVGTGRGDLLSPVLARTPLHWVLALAEQGLSTPAVFAELDRLRAPATGKSDPRGSAPVDGILSALASGDPVTVAAALGNDLQAAAISLQPGLRRTLRAGHRGGCAGRPGVRVRSHRRAVVRRCGISGRGRGGTGRFRDLPDRSDGIRAGSGREDRRDTHRSPALIGSCSRPAWVRPTLDVTDNGP